jgi:hypothetical protein
MLDLALLDQISYRTCNLFNGYARVDAMLLEKVDRFDTEPLQRAVYGLPDIVRPAAQALRFGLCFRPKVEAKLGRNHHLVPQWGERLTEKLFVHKGTVHLSRVEEIDAPFDCAP